MRKEKGVIFNFGFFSIKSSDGKRYKKASKKYIKDNWELKRSPVKHGSFRTTCTTIGMNAVCTTHINIKAFITKAFIF
ncbi:hypothetical protein [Bacteriovorax sp. BAL6_X]|uniref:hypothetical protein n=1 Tax=Bacteriovorax sp. BAL6_X TaxID=1201290 RepID=UPI00040CEB4F|nr:hypothetical protein [Bacteriovorax sp. BAL6_X]